MDKNKMKEKIKIEKRKNNLLILLSIILLIIVVILGTFLAGNFVSAQTPSSNGTQTIVEATYCCEKTTSGLFCQDAPQSQCSNGINPQTGVAFLKAPTSCRSTSYCKPGTCYDSYEGTCASNTPRVVCNGNNGTWAEGSPAQCDLGCCVLGDQAAFVPLVRCKRLSAFLGVETNYKSDITDEVSCVLSVQNQDKGACVYTVDFEKTCRVLTRAECVGTNSNLSDREFHKGKLCTAEELGTNCGMTTKTTCLDGKEEVYFVDTCGNPANIYDSSKITDDEYWATIKDKSESCKPDESNAGSPDCGNCNYPLGSYCRSTKLAGDSVTYGDYVCADLNCYDTGNGKDYKHGESWCVFDDKGTTGQGDNSVGSRFYKHICNNGQEVLEQCADYRQEECIQDSITGSDGLAFSQAACRVNRWQDCIAQDEKIDCTNTDRRDCFWKEFDVEFNFSLNYMGSNTSVSGMCLPQNPPGLKFWGESILAVTKTGPASYSDYKLSNSSGAVTNGISSSSGNGEEAEKICAIADAQCIVTLEKSLFDDEWKCNEDDEDANCQCWDQSTKGAADEWVEPHVEVCKAMGDCGPKINWIGKEGYKSAYNITVTKANKSGNFGLFDDED
jgi:hypothetical protein